MKITQLTEARRPSPLVLLPLPYDIAALEPVMHRDVVQFHYKTLSKGYVDRYNAGEGDPEFNRAGALLHNLWWPQLRPPRPNNQPRGLSRQLIDSTHGSWDNFKHSFTKTALDLQGSGWCYMAKDGSIKTLTNQSWKNDVVMPIDLWEHSMNPYTLRKDYIKTIWQLIDWEAVSQRLK